MNNFYKRIEKIYKPLKKLYDIQNHLNKTYAIIHTENPTW